VIAVCKHEDDLLHVSDRVMGYFPQTDSGACAGFYPSDSLGAMAQLEAVRARGADYLLFPAEALWWLDFYSAFAEYLDRNYHLVAHREGLCSLYSLQERSPDDDRGLPWRLREIIVDFEQRFGREPAILDWDTGLDLAGMFPQLPVFSPPNRHDVLPYLDQTIDIVAVTPSCSLRLREARRVSCAAVIRLTNPGISSGEPPHAPAIDGWAIEVEWRGVEERSGTPAVSVIVPMGDTSPGMRAWLTSLGRRLQPTAGVEFLVVDDGASDGLASLESGRTDGQVHLVATAQETGLAAQCNEAAGRAAGEILVFLAADSVPLLDWLSPMIHTFRLHRDAGAVGGKLIGPDGSLIEAGARVAPTGMIEHFARGDFQTDAPAHNYVRVVDCVSSALLATRRSLFLELGGFDPETSPVEDVDYCFRVRQAGFRVYYQPDAAALHFGSRTKNRLESSQGTLHR
jgi:GT2 family glycosyltransferase